jgi:hypothetical protein
MIDYAKELGYRSVIFNRAFSETQSAPSLGKDRFPCAWHHSGAVRKNDAIYQDALIMFRSLV